MTKDNTNKGFWERFAKMYAPFMEKNHIAYNTICESLDKYMDDSKKVLELACGTGQITFRMAEKCDAWEATDYSEKMLKRQKEEVRKWGSRTIFPFRFRMQPI